MEMAEFEWESLRVNIWYFHSRYQKLDGYTPNLLGLSEGKQGIPQPNKIVQAFDA